MTFVREGRDQHVPSQVVAVAIIAVAATVGCAAEDGADSTYCEDIRDSRTALEAFSGDNVAELSESFETIHRISGEAPETVKDDWASLDGGIDTVDRAMTDAELSFGDLSRLQRGDLPSDVSQDELQTVAKALESMGSESLARATANIERHANNVCKVPLDGF